MNDADGMQQLHEESPAMATQGTDNQVGSTCRCESDARVPAVIGPAALLQVPRPLLRRRVEDEPRALLPVPPHASVPADSSAGSDCVKRRRLAGKQHSEQYPLPPAAPTGDATLHGATNPESTAGWKLVRHAKQLFATHCLRKRMFIGGTYEQKRRKCFAMWVDMDSRGKQSWIDKARKDEPFHSQNAGAVAAQAGEVGPPAAADATDEVEPAADDNKEVRPAGLLLTFNGEWGQ